MLVYGPQFIAFNLIYQLLNKGTTELAAYAVGSMFAGVTGWSLAVGIVTAMDMNKEEFEEEDEDLTYLGIQLQRTFLSLAALFLPVSFVWWHASTLLSFLGQNDEITQLAGKRSSSLCTHILSFITVLLLIHKTFSLRSNIPTISFNWGTSILFVRGSEKVLSDTRYCQHPHQSIDGCVSNQRYSQLCIDLPSESWADWSIRGYFYHILAVIFIHGYLCFASPRKRSLGRMVTTSIFRLYGILGPHISRYLHGMLRVVGF
jgi:hypothetical protein